MTIQPKQESQDPVLVVILSFIIVCLIGELVLSSQFLEGIEKLSGLGAAALGVGLLSEYALFVAAILSLVYVVTQIFKTD